MDSTKTGGEIGGQYMLDLSTAPKKIKAILLLCIIGTLISIGTIFYVYSFSRHAVQTVGKDTVPQIIAARHIKATLANAHSNAMNAMVTKEKLGGKFWSLYRSDLNSLHAQLIDASKNITYGEKEQIPLLSILSNISAYEFTVGGAVASGSEISVDQFMEANRLMQQKILPASSALDKANLSQLESTYDNYSKNISYILIFMCIVAFIYLMFLIFVQIYLFKNTHRVFNIGVVLATIIFIGNFSYSMMSLNSVKVNLNAAKQSAFDSLDYLWSARAVAYNAKSLESLYLLHQGTGIVQTADTINFNLSAQRLCSDPKAALSNGDFKGYLKDTLNNITTSEEKTAVTTALQQWGKYVEIDKMVRNLEYDSKHNEAIILSVGDESGQANYEFKKFDEALDNAININQTNFDNHIKIAFKTLKLLPYLLAAFLLMIIIACIIGLKARLDEYKL